MSSLKYAATFNKDVKPVHVLYQVECGRKRVDCGNAFNGRRACNVGAGDFA